MTHGSPWSMNEVPSRPEALGPLSPNHRAPPGVVIAALLVLLPRPGSTAVASEGPGQDDPLDPSAAVPIASVIADRDGDRRPERIGDTVTVAGRVTLGTGVFHPDRMTASLQDATGGVALYADSTVQPLTAGDSVVARGRLILYNGRPQIVEPRLRVIDAPPRHPAPVALSSLHFDTLERYEGRLARVRSPVLRVTRNEGGQVLSLGPEPDEPRLRVFVPNLHREAIDLERYSAGDEVRVTGILGQFDEGPPLDDNYQIYPRRSADVEAIGIPGAVLERWLLYGGVGLLLVGLVAWGVVLTIQVRRRRAAEEKFSKAFHTGSLAAAFIRIDDGAIVEANQGTKSVFGYEREELLGRTVDEVGLWTGSGDRRRLLVRAREEEGPISEEVEMVARDGTVRDVLAFAQTLELGDEEYVYASALDISERKALEAELEHRALHDGLTDLPNRVLFHDRLEQAIARTRRFGGSMALAFVDLDGFKVVNDSLGHPVGDRVLERIARRLESAVRDHDTVARVGGDEFTALLEDLASQREAHEPLDRLVEAIEEPLEVGGERVHLTASVGVVYYGDQDGEPEARTPDDLVQAADHAMYRSKERDERYTFYSGGWGREHEGRLHTENRIRRGLRQDEFRSFYQPILSLRTDEVVAIEALARWDDPDRGLLSPADFIPVAEKRGLIGELGRALLRKAVADLDRWTPGSAGRRLRLHVNVSARQLRTRRLLKALNRALSGTGVDRGQVVLEVTESEVMRRRKQVRALDEHGYRVSIDDFGTGYSSLSYLTELDVRGLKIDRSFVDGLAPTGDGAPSSRAASSERRSGSSGSSRDRGKDALRAERARRSRGVVDTILTLGRQLELEIVAEGVETADQAEYLRRTGCPFAQGFYFARPMPAERFERWRADRNG